MLANLNSNFSVLNNYHDFDNNVNDEDDDDVRMLFRAWVNERECPTLLNSETETLENVLELLANQQALLEEVEDISVENDYIHCLYEMEMERIRYVCGSYIRCRLDKIEGNWMLGDGDIFDRLTEEEKQYFTSFKRIKTAALGKWSGSNGVNGGNVADEFSNSCSPLTLSPEGVDGKKAVEEGRHLIFRVLKDDLGDLQIDPTSLTKVQLQRGDIYVVKAAIAIPLLRRGDVELV